MGNYLFNFETPGKAFHVINISWFSVKVYHKFVASTFAVHFLQEVFLKALNVLSVYAKQKSPTTQVFHCPCMTFSMEKIRSSVPWQYLC